MPGDLDALLARLDELHGKLTHAGSFMAAQDAISDWRAAMDAAYPQLRSELARLQAVERAAREYVTTLDDFSVGRVTAIDVNAKRAAFDRAAGGAP